MPKIAANGKSARRKSQPCNAARYGDAPSAKQRIRLAFLMATFFLVFGLIAIRLTQLHLYPRLELADEEGYHYLDSVTLKRPRGDILDRNGLLLATDSQAFSLAVDPKLIDNPQHIADILQARLGLNATQVLAEISKRDAEGKLRRFVRLKRWLKDAPVQALEAIKADAGRGIILQSEPLRYYPEGDTAAHILGFVQRDGVAAEGIERQMDAHLRSEPGKKKGRVDSRGRLLPSLLTQYTEPTGGANVELTIDTAIQHILERELDHVMAPENANAPRAMGMVMDPRTGAILALASRPAFDPNRYDEFDAKYRKNRAITDVFEPGSAFKIVTAAAVLEHGLVTPDTLIDCENGSFNPYGHRIRDSHELGIIPFSETFASSSNIATIKVAALLGESRLDHWIRRFGFGERVTPDFGGVESRGIYHPLKKWSGLTMGALPIGQEISVTVPQLAKAFAMIANGGFTVEPYVVEKVVAIDGETIYLHNAPESRRMLSANTIQTMHNLCHQVVLQGTGVPAGIAEYRVGGKTGTGQIAIPGGYSKDKFTAVFAGFAPLNNPRLVAVIIVQEPAIKAHYGGTVSGPVFKNIVREALIRMSVPEDPVVLPVVASETLPEQYLADIYEETKESILDELEPLDNLELIPHNVNQSEGTPKLPNFWGMTKRRVKDELTRFEIPWDPQGAGWVVSQYPPPHTPLSEVTLCALQFSNKTSAPLHDQN